MFAGEAQRERVMSVKTELYAIRDDKFVKQSIKALPTTACVFDRDIHTLAAAVGVTAVPRSL